VSVNREKPHVLVLPEDDANRQLANGFLLELDPALSRNIQVLPEAGGWGKVLDEFETDQIVGMEHYPHRFIIMLIDFDGQENRLQQAKAKIPEWLVERVFILGTSSEPEDLKRSGLGSYESIGSAMAKDCRDDTDHIWQHDLLQHNKTELDRLRQYVRPILFARPAAT
jgi:hypothetical protein